jgi:hypothetical protein
MYGITPRGAILSVVAPLGSRRILYSPNPLRARGAGLAQALYMSCITPRHIVFSCLARFNPLIAFLGLAVAFTGCGVRPNSAAEEGIVEIGVAARASAPVFDASASVVWVLGEEHLQVGEQLGTRGMPSLLSLGSGRYLLTNGTWLAVHARASKELWRIGREGHGPNEFRSLGETCAYNGDTILTADGVSPRLSLIVPMSGSVSEFPANARRWQLADCRGNGEVLSTRRMRRRDGGGR